MNFTNFTRRKRFGGNVIGHGGFGCVFHPNLECQLIETGEIVKPKYNKISKLFKNSYYYKEETRDLKIIKKIIDKIPHHTKYFITQTVQCKPIRISRKDLANFDKECKKFSRYTSKQLLKFNSLITPYGGKNLREYVASNKTNVVKMIQIHEGLIDIFKHAIVPLNKLNTYHCDIKLDNMVFDNENIRIIDFGFVSIFNNHSIPHKFREFPVHFNMPLTILLFDQSVQLDIYNQTTIDVSSSTKSGHFQILNRMYKNTKPTKFNDLDFDTFVQISLSNVVSEFTSAHGEFDEFEFFSKVYVHNVDIHGFVIAYYNLIKHVVPLHLQYELKRFTFDIVFNSFTKRIYPQNILKKIADMKYLHTSNEN